MKIKEFKYFYPEKPVLVHRDQSLVDDISNDPNWVAEPKYNGTRLMLHIIDGKIEFWGRHGDKLAYNNSPSQEIISKLQEMFPKGYYLFDGELRHNKVTGMKHRIVLWDVFIYNHELLYKQPYWARRSLLENHLTVGDNQDISLIEQYADDFRKHFADYTEGRHGDPDEFEGLVMKNLQGKIKPGRNSGANSSWMYKIRKETGRHKF